LLAAGFYDRVHEWNSRFCGGMPGRAALFAGSGGPVPGAAVGPWAERGKLWIITCFTPMHQAAHNARKMPFAGHGACGPHMRYASGRAKNAQRSSVE